MPDSGNAKVRNVTLGAGVRIADICMCAVFSALVFVMTFVNIRLPIPGNGGLIHMGNIPLVIAAVVLGKKYGAVSGAIGMTLFDLLGGWFLWAPFTFIIRAAMGFVIGLIIENKTKHRQLWYITAVAAGGAILVVGYYIAEWIIYGNFLLPIGSVPGNLLQVASALVLGLPIAQSVQVVYKRLKHSV